MAQHLSSKNLLYSREPLVVGAVSQAATLSALGDMTGLADECDVVELRLDTLGLSPAEVHEHAKRQSRPILITARHPDEGGHGGLSVAERSALLDACLDLAALVDVELRSAMDLQNVISKAKARGVGVIGSYHDFNATPSDDVLRGAVDFGLQFKLDAVKIATTLNSGDDLARLIQLLDREKRIPLSVMGMGGLGRVSRITLARCGSVLNYGYIGESNAPGQWPARRLKELLKDV
jgi:3-dehydroquinate dehydratase-1